MTEDIREIKEDIKEIKGDLKEISKIMGANTASLVTHEYRTTLSERRIERFESGIRWILGLIASGILAALIKLVLK